MSKRIEQDFETSLIEYERWKSAILNALHEMRCASVDGLNRHGCFGQGAGQDRATLPPLSSSSGAR
jgi:hypothetical protein